MRGRNRITTVILSVAVCIGGVLLSLQDSAVEAAQSKKPAAEAPPVYLDDLKESGFRCGNLNRLGKRGATALKVTTKCRMRRKVQSHALATHAIPNGTAHVTYDLAGKYKTFKAFAGIMAPAAGDGLAVCRRLKWKGNAASALTFRVVGDGKVLWKSRAIQKNDDWQQCIVNVEKVRSLRLEVVCPGRANFGWSAWVQARLYRPVAAGTVAKKSSTPNPKKPVPVKPAAPSASKPPAAARLVAVSLASVLPAASRVKPSAPMIVSDGPVSTWFHFPSLGGWVMTPDNVTLIVSVPTKAQIVFLNTTTDKEIKRIETDFKPSKLAVQGNTLFAAVQGGSLVYALDMKTGKVKRRFKYAGEPAQSLVCHPKRGSLFLTDLGEKVFALDPASGKAVRTAGRGMFLAIDPVDGKFLYAGTNRPSKDFMEVTRGPGKTTRIRFVTVAERAAVLKYAVNGSKLKLVAGNSNTAVGFGGFLHVSPTGKQFAMVAGGGWWSSKNQRVRHDIAVFDTKDMTTMRGGIKAGGPKRIAFHPVLKLGVAYGADYVYHFFNSRSLVSRGRRQNPARRKVSFGSDLLTFGGRGTRLIASQGGHVAFMPLELKDSERAALRKVYGALPPAPQPFVSLKGVPKDWKLRPLADWKLIMPDRGYEYTIKTLPVELADGVMLQRPRHHALSWLNGGRKLNFARDGVVCVAIVCKAGGKVVFPDKDLQTLSRDGWKLLDAKFETERAGQNSFEWKVLAKAVKKGPVHLGFHKLTSKSYRVFMFR